MWWFLFVGGVVIVNADGVAESVGFAVFKEFLGFSTYFEDVNVDAVFADLLCCVSVVALMVVMGCWVQVICDLCVIVSVDG